jgi:hypothetical protein
VRKWAYLVLAAVLFCLMPGRAFGLAMRTEVNGTYSFVGYGVISGFSPHCTYSIVRHGLLLTAKHCFKHRAASAAPILPSQLSVLFPNNIEISANSIQEIILDEGDNDIAWVTYDAQATIGRIDLPEIIFSDRLPEIDSKFDMPGSPVSGRQRTRDFTKVVDCQLTGREGRFPPKPRDLGYEGLLIEMDCPAWYGQSGSPILNQGDGATIVLYGVLAHTFDVLADGSVDSNSIERDEIGNFVRRSIFSPIFLREYQE